MLRGNPRIHPVTNPTDQFPVLLLVVLGGVFAVAMAKVFFLNHMSEKRRRESILEEIPDYLYNQPGFAEHPSLFQLPFNHPTAWLAIRNRNVDLVLETFGLQNATPCTWEDGLANAVERGIFVSPPIGGWTLVLGPCLPAPDDDIDALFRTITDLSARLGHVQYFHANAALSQHAWAKSEYGRILRAFAWTDRTVWNQGRPTLAEARLGMVCPDYGDEPREEGMFGQPDFAVSNTERVPALAARWSVDLASVNAQSPDLARGVAGDPRMPGLG